MTVGWNGGFMSRAINKLTNLKVKSLHSPGRYSDGGGLFLQITKRGTKSWIFRFQISKKEFQMGLGPINTVSLSEAREMALNNRQLILKGTNPLNERREARAKEKCQRQSHSFAYCADAFIEAHKGGWRNSKHIDQWRNTLKTYAYPVIGNLCISEVTVDHVIEILQPIWNNKTETASRLRSRIENVLDWAAARGFRASENPARWRGHLDKIFPRPSKVYLEKHHAALPLSEINNFVSKIRSIRSTSSFALEFLILTATRTSETIHARWEEIDLEKSMWVIPRERMKSFKEHRVPLNSRAVSILADMEKIRNSSYIFPGGRKGKPLSNMAMLKLCKNISPGTTVHGFRSTFRDWASERTNFTREVAEAALAHAIKDKTEAAYRRGDLFFKRARMLEEWQRFIDAPFEKRILSIHTERSKNG